MSEPANQQPVIPLEHLAMSDKIRLYRIVLGFLLVSLLWKFRAIPLFYSVYQSIPLHDEFFPDLLRSPSILAALFLVAVIANLIVLFVADRSVMIAQSWLNCLALFGMCLHQGSYNDVTFLTCFWVSIWCVWYVSRIGDEASELYAKGGRLAVLIFSLIFLGGAVGKLTPGYWSGEVFYQIYFVKRDFWIFNLLRQNFEVELLRTIATYYSRMVLTTELSCAFLWLLPTRLACGMGIVVFLSIAVFSNTYLFSVMFCLFGLGIAGLHQPPGNRRNKKN